jgi:formylglycine-generating enzyme required for sulfatase activity
MLENKPKEERMMFSPIQSKSEMRLMKCFFIVLSITLLVFISGCDKRDAAMVLVPAGPYDMGADYGAPYSLPIHTVTVPAFYMDIYEVTNAQYKAFCDATSRAYPPQVDTGMPNYFTSATYANYPVVMVTWYDASAYASWVGSEGKYG